MWHEGSLAGDVQIQRVKFHYFEKYVYGMAQTADTLEVARRAATWLVLYMWRRGLFEVQYAGMSAEARAAAMAARRDGFAGMPDGAQISNEEAFHRWLDGERAYALALKTEPLFVRLNVAMQFSTVELHTEEVGAVFSELGEELGLEPLASGLNSGRRNGVVGTSKALDERACARLEHGLLHGVRMVVGIALRVLVRCVWTGGMTQMLAKKLMQHKAKSGVMTIEVSYHAMPGAGAVPRLLGHREGRRGACARLRERRGACVTARGGR